MNKSLDIKIYSAIADSLKPTESYLGYVDYNFHYTISEYQATCTEAYPFNPFDTVICELLQIEDSLSFHEIGKVLGLNVGAVENDKVIKDNAEYEILMEALQSLADFNMIEGGDINFSRCRLTDIGKEYAIKKHRFKKTENKRFTVYFDKTTGHHPQAKENFDFVDSIIDYEHSSEISLSEQELKNIVAIQNPDIYDEKKLFSFTDAIVVTEVNHVTDFKVGLSVNIENKTVRCFCYKQDRGVNSNLSDWINSQATLVISFINQLNDVEYTNHINTVDLLIDPHSFVGEYLLWTRLQEFLSEEEQTMYINYPIVTKDILSSIESCLSKLTGDSKCFISIPEPERTYVKKYSEQFGGLISSHEPSAAEILHSSLRTLSCECVNLFLGNSLPANPVFIIKTTSQCIIFEKRDYALYINEKKFVIKGYIKNLVTDSVLIESEMLDYWANYYIKNEDDEYANLSEIIDSYILSFDGTHPNVDDFKTLFLLKEKIEIFDGYGNKKNDLNMALDKINKFYNLEIELIENRFRAKISELKTRVALKNSHMFFDEINAELASLEQDTGIIIQSIELKSIIDEFKKEFQMISDEYEKSKICYSFIIDTNILLEDPEVILKVDKKHAIIIAAKVLDELDKFKMDKNLSAIVSRAVKIIQQDKNRNIRHNKGRPKLLPPDLNQKTPDNLILSVAIQYHNNHGILITSDNLLTVKAQNVLDLKVMNLQEFKTKFDQSIKS